LGVPATAVEARVPLVMSGGTEGGLSPHWLVFTVDHTPGTTLRHEHKSLAIGVAFTRLFTPEDIGRRTQAAETARAVKAAMADAAIADASEDRRHAPVCFRRCRASGSGRRWSTRGDHLVALLIVSGVQRRSFASQTAAQQGKSRSEGSDYCRLRQLEEELC